MPEDTSNPFATMIGALANKGGKRGVIKDSEGKVSPHLTPAEVSRYEKIFGIMKKVVNPGPETGQLDTVPVGKVGSTAAMQQAAGAGGDGSGGGFGTAALAALAAAGLAQFWDEIMLGLENFFGETLPNVGVVVGKGMIVAAKVLGKVGLKLFPKLAGLVGKPLLKAMRFLPFIGTIASFALAYMDFTKPNPDYVGGGLNLLSGLINLIPVVGNIASIVLDGFIIWREFQNSDDEDTSKNEDDIKQGKTPLGSAGSEIWFTLSRKLRYLPIIGGLYRWGVAYREFEADNYLSGIKNLALGFLSFKYGDLAGEVVDGVVFGKGIATYEWLDGNENKGEDDFKKYNGEGLNNLNKHLATKKMSFFEQLGAEMGTLIDVFFGDLNPSTSGPKDPKNPKSNSKSKEGNIPQSNDVVVKSVLVAGVAAARIRDGLKNSPLLKNNPLFNSEAAEDVIAGSLLAHKSRDGSRLKDRKLEWALMKQDIMARANGYVSPNERYGFYGAGTPKVEDGIIYQNGRATRIDDEDSLLAAKSGGPIDKMLDGNSKVMKSIASINAQQLNVLVEIREGIKSLGQSGGLSFNNAPLAQEFFE